MKNKSFRKLSALALCTLSVSCQSSDIVLSKRGEAILKSGCNIAHVVAQSERARKVTTTGLNVTFNAKRRYQTFRGSKGLWYGNSYLWGGDRFVYEEGYQHFWSMAEAQQWLEWNRQRGVLAVSPKGGVLLLENPRQGRFRLELWQFYVRGVKAVGLAAPTKCAFDLQDCAPEVTTDRSLPPLQIGGRKFSGRAMALLRDRRISPHTILAVLNAPEHTSTNTCTGYSTVYEEGIVFAKVILAPDKTVVSIE